jgi:DNA-binding beta-propeller fold protein YncE
MVASIVTYAGLDKSKSAASAESAVALGSDSAPELINGRRANDSEAQSRNLAPELEGGVQWLNTPRPIRLKDLRGKIVLLDFWTLCCINCIHTLPDLARLEKKYANELVVIGIHCGKFDNEKNSGSIAKAIHRYDIHHPVVNDAHLRIWRDYDVNGWPTLCLIDPEGYVVAQASGEGLYDTIDRAVASLIKLHRAKKTLNEGHLKLESPPTTEYQINALYFPGKLLTDPSTRRLFIADSGHNRIVITNLDGKKIAIVGSGEAGWTDGAFDRACFNDPQGLALSGQTLYVADRKNHLIRAVDLQERRVSTVAGTGRQGQDRQKGGPALQIGLNSPWDLLIIDNRIYIAMAGDHQIWTFDPGNGMLNPFAGTGAEDLLDGTYDKACFAQPSGLTSDGTQIYVADSEASAIRSLPAAETGEVQSIVGKGLFDFGDEEGPVARARLQHPLALAYQMGKLYVADTYNNKIKVVDLLTKRVRALSIKTESGQSMAPFNEPAGLSFSDDKLYVADTNAHCIRVVDIKTCRMSTLILQDLSAPK